MSPVDPFRQFKTIIEEGDLVLAYLVRKLEP